MALELGLMVTVNYTRSALSEEDWNETRETQQDNVLLNKVTIVWV